MQRKLASIQRVSRIEPIPGADSIEKLTVMGWSLVSGKGNFKEGDKCVFFEIDSVLPATAEWASFMEPHKFRVKTIKLRGQLSQGLALPMDIMPKGDHGSYKIDDDVTELLGVAKYEPTNVSPDAIGPFPSDVPKTDEIRLQSALGVMDEIRDKPFYVTVKLDGTSGTFVRREDSLQVCSRNRILKESDGAHWTVARRYDLANKLPIGLAVQGEVCGPGIQKNRLGLKEPDLFIFSVYDTGTGSYLSWDQVVFLCIKHGLKTVPFDFEVGEDELASFPFTLENFLGLAQGTYDGTKNRREGIVVRPLRDCRSETLGGSRLSFKVIANDFLLKDGE